MLICRLPARPVGLSRLTVFHSIYGKDKSYSFVDYGYEVTKVDPLSGGTLGGNEILLTGSGLGDHNSSSVSVTICGQPCSETEFIDRENDQLVKCTAPPMQDETKSFCDIEIACEDCVKETGMKQGLAKIKVQNQTSDFSINFSNRGYNRSLSLPIGIHYFPIKICLLGRPNPGNHWN